MGIRKLIASTLLGAVVMGVLAGGWHLVLMGAYYREEVAGLRQVFRLDVLALAYLVLAALMAVIYPKGYAGGAPLVEGFRFGVVMGLIAALPHSMVLFAVSDAISGSAVLGDAAWHMVEQGAGGAAIGLVYGRAFLDGASSRVAGVEEETT
ncbi:MAG: hypothetical protein ABIL09_15970 [Gemmatimonadota bacterium]